MPASHLEVERKYDATDVMGVPPLESVPGVVTVDRPAVHELEATYYDVEGLTLARSKVTLRRRTGGEDEGWHLKMPAGSDARRETHAPLGDGDGVPEELAELVEDLVTPDQLRPIAILSTRRHVYVLRGGDGQVLAEFCDDYVHARTFATSGEVRTSAWREWEVELSAGGRDLLDAVEGAVLAVGGKRAAGPSKLARALGDDLGSS